MVAKRGTEFDWAIQNEEAFKKSLDKLGKETSDFRIPFRLIASDWYRSNRKLFTLQGRGLYTDLSKKPFFAWWEKDSDLRKYYDDGYQGYKKAKVGFTYPILVGETRDLSNSILGKNNKGSVFSVDRQALAMGTDIEYAKYHQSDEPRDKMPLRKLVFIDGGPADKSKDSSINGRRERWTSIIDTHVQQLVSGSVF